LPARALIARAFKRGIDVLGASVAILLFAPLMLIIAALVAAEGGAVIFAHERLGRSGRPFRCFKFRTMAPNAEARLRELLKADPIARRQWERDHKLTPDPRVTPLGQILRETSLDELPQFFNVLVGDMSLVGPRPITEQEVTKYGRFFADYANCRPGITGIWQVSGRNDVAYSKRVALDAFYARRQSVLFDLGIMFRTFGVVLSRSGAR
jgi:undecaprenyl-phosphate galactose phosphotransferase